jgi:hypothetical protein
VVLFQMIETGGGGAAYYADVTQAEIGLAVSHLAQHGKHR